MNIDLKEKDEMDTAEENVKAPKKSNVRRNITVVLVVLCICAAVYWNYSYNHRNADDTLDASLVEAKNNEEIEAASGEVGSYISEYFAMARLTRQQSRDEALALLETAASSENASQETIDSAMNAIAAMASYSMQETQIENLLLAKDFAECVVFMSAEGITVAVPTSPDGLTAEQAARITDAIITETSYNATQLHILEIKEPSAGSQVETSGEAGSGGLIGSGEDAGAPVGSEGEGEIDIETQGGYVDENGVTVYE
ncbi:MAG: SpoIIIAH-like family protein [Oscillospiraceae bacterium]|jgi:stage III sporulation protein AH|nr:SpoIIIAH-like family protein [Oscillospiraceae bacterium]